MYSAGLCCLNAAMVEHSVRLVPPSNRVTILRLIFLSESSLSISASYGPL
jgi:hypothetical protein